MQQNRKAADCESAARQTFLDRLNDAYTVLRSDPMKWSEVERERAAWGQRSKLRRDASEETRQRCWLLKMACGFSWGYDHGVNEQ